MRDRAQKGFWIWINRFRIRIQVLAWIPIWIRIQDVELLSRISCRVCGSLFNERNMLLDRVRYRFYSPTRAHFNQIHQWCIGIFETSAFMLCTKLLNSPWVIKCFFLNLSAKPGSSPIILTHGTEDQDRIRIVKFWILKKPKSSAKDWQRLVGILYPKLWYFFIVRIRYYCTDPDHTLFFNGF